MGLMNANFVYIYNHQNTLCAGTVHNGSRDRISLKVILEIYQIILAFPPFLKAQDKTLKGSLPQEQSPWVPTPGEQITWAPTKRVVSGKSLTQKSAYKKGICDRFLLDYQLLFTFGFHLLSLISLFLSQFLTRFVHIGIQPTNKICQLYSIPMDEASFVNLSQFCQPNVLDEVFCHRRWRKWNEQPLPA